MQDKLFTRAEIETTDKGMLAIASTAVEDRTGEVIQAEGWNLKEFIKNPVLQWAHDYSIPAIGVAKNIRVEGTGKRAKLLFEPVFHELTQEAKAIKAMIEEGILKAFSVGFRPLQHKQDPSTGALTFTEQELLEISVVNVPANAQALMLATKTLETKGFNEALIESLLPDLPDTRLDDLAAKLAALEASHETVVKGLKHLNPRPVDQANHVRVTKNLHLLKVVDKVTSKMLADSNAGRDMDVSLIRVIDKVTERLLVDTKQELTKHGQN